MNKEKLNQKILLVRKVVDVISPKKNHYESYWDGTLPETIDKNIKDGKETFKNYLNKYGGEEFANH